MRVSGKASAKIFPPLAKIFPPLAKIFPPLAKIFPPQKSKKCPF